MAAVWISVMVMGWGMQKDYQYYGTLELGEAQDGKTVQLDVIIEIHLTSVFVSLLNCNINFCRREFLN